jgi:hypothetical protein
MVRGNLVRKLLAQQQGSKDESKKDSKINSKRTSQQDKTFGTDLVYKKAFGYIFFIVKIIHYKIILNFLRNHIDNYTLLGLDTFSLSFT